MLYVIILIVVLNGVLKVFSGDDNCVSVVICLVGGVFNVNLLIRLVIYGKLVVGLMMLLVVFIIVRILMVILDCRVVDVVLILFLSVLVCVLIFMFIVLIVMLILVVV